MGREHARAPTGRRRGHSEAMTTQRFRDTASDPVYSDKTCGAPSLNSSPSVDRGDRPARHPGRAAASSHLGGAVARYRDRAPAISAMRRTKLRLRITPPLPETRRLARRVTIAHPRIDRGQLCLEPRTWVWRRGCIAARCACDDGARGRCRWGRPCAGRGARGRRRRQIETVGIRARAAGTVAEHRRSGIATGINEPLPTGGWRRLDWLHHR